MKKLLIMALMASLVSLGLASNALAIKVLTNYSATTIGTPVGAAVDGTAGVLGLGQTNFAVSTNVKLVATGNGGGFNVASKHIAGDFDFRSSSVAAGIQETAATKGVDMVSTQLLNTNTNDVYTGTGGF